MDGCYSSGDFKFRCKPACGGPVERFHRSSTFPGLKKAEQTTPYRRPSMRTDPGSPSRLRRDQRPGVWLGGLSMLSHLRTGPLYRQSKIVDTASVSVMSHESVTSPPRINDNNSESDGSVAANHNTAPHTISPTPGTAFRSINNRMGISKVMNKRPIVGQSSNVRNGLSVAPI
jgi:hypothetical protein